MAIKISSLFVELKANIAKYSSGMNEARKKSKITAEAITKNLKKIAAPLAAIGTAAAAAFAVMVKSAINTGDELAKLSEQTGISTETLSGFGFAAEQAGINLEELGQRFVNLARRTKEADRGVISYRLSFDALNIQLRDAQGNLRRTEDIFLDIADRFSEMEDGTRKAAIATDLFSNQGTRLIPLLNLGSKGIKDLADQAKGLGIVWTQDAARAAEEFNDQLNVMKRRMTGLATAVATELLPSLNQAAAALTGNALAVELMNVRFNRALLSIARLFTEATFLLPIRVFSKELARSLNPLQKLIDQTFQDETDLLVKFNAEMAGLAALVRTQTGPALNELAAATDKSKDAVKEAVDALRLQLDTYGLSADQLAIYKLALLTNDEAILTNAENILAQKRALEEEDKALKAVADELKRASEAQKALAQTMKAEGQRVFEQTRTVLERFAEELRKLWVLVNEGAISWDTYNRAVMQAGVEFKEATKVINELEEAGKRMGETISESLQEMIVRGRGLRDILGGLLQDLQRIFLRAAFKPITNALSGALGGVFGGLTSRQHGGPLAAGQPAIVGEGGVPELFVPKSSGNIIPFDKLRGGGGGTVVNIDARGAAPGMERKIASLVLQAIKSTQAGTIARIQDARLRSG